MWDMHSFTLFNIVKDRKHTIRTVLFKTILISVSENLKRHETAILPFLKENAIGHIRILGIGLELACNGGLCGLIFSHANHTKLFLMIFPRISLHCKLDPVQYREYEYDLFTVSTL